MASMEAVAAGEAAGLAAMASAVVVEAAVFDGGATSFCQTK